MRNVKYYLILAILMLTGSPSHAKAFGNCAEYSVAAIINNLVNQVPVPVTVALMIIAGVSGTYLVLSSMIVLARSDPNERLSNSIIRIVVGSFLTSLPVLLTLSSQTLGLDSAAIVADIDLNCVKAENNSSFYSAFIENFAVNAGRPLAIGAYMFSMVAGVFFVFAGIRGFVDIASQRTQLTFKACFGKLLVGAVLFNLPFFANELVQNTFFNDAALTSNEYCESPLSHKVGNDGGDYKLTSFKCKSGAEDDATGQMVRVIELSMMAIFPFGLFAIVSGLIALKGLTDGNAGNDAQALRSAVVRITAGALMMNMGATTCAINNTLGVDQLLSQSNDIASSALVKFCGGD